MSPYLSDKNLYPYVLARISQLIYVYIYKICYFRQKSITAKSLHTFVHAIKLFYIDYARFEI